MKSNQSQSGSILEPFLKGLVEPSKPNTKSSQQDPSVESTPPESPDLYQDPGGAYNSGFVFPQE